jgi:uncharacterized protein
MQLEWNERKRQETLRERGLDFADAKLFFDGRPVLTEPSSRDDEQRWRSTTIIAGDFVTMIWTMREDALRVITMRRAHAKEEGQYRQLFA